MALSKGQFAGTVLDSCESQAPGIRYSVPVHTSLTENQEQYIRLGILTRSFALTWPHIQKVAIRQRPEE